MEQNPPNKYPAASPLGSVRKDAEAIGTVRKASESFGSLPNVSERFRNLPNVSEAFGNLPNVAERKENHTLSVREVSRLFEAAGVARTERSIVNWCHKNAQGVARLDAYFDPNEGKYFITPESVELAIIEEKAKVAKNNAPSEAFGNVPNSSELAERHERTNTDTDSIRVGELEKEVMDLKITNRAKDYFIAQMKQEQQDFAEERKEFVAQLVSANRRVGELETQLLQLAEPSESRVRKLEVRPQSAN